MNEDLDKIIKKKIDADVQYCKSDADSVKDKIWQNISKTNKKKRILPFMYVAAGIVFFIGVYFVIKGKSDIDSYRISHDNEAYEHYTNNCEVQYGLDECTVQTNRLVCCSNQGTTESDIRNGMKQGNAVNYSADGTIHEKGKYVNGTKHGEWLYFDKDGQLIEKKTFNNGVDSN